MVHLLTDLKIPLLLAGASSSSQKSFAIYRCDNVELLDGNFSTAFQSWNYFDDSDLGMLCFTRSGLRNSAPCRVFAKINYPRSPLPFWFLV